MITKAMVEDMMTFSEEDQNKVAQLVLFIKRKQELSAAEWLDRERKKYADRNPMTMEEIDRIIHED